ncbi:hypothetical protein BJ944DRAFT_266086 [Cunninghamella echinulata]|nr:hypothetical protein BJ944DRAFT_266086 [Cunninghamella echinulata]
MVQVAYIGLGNMGYVIASQLADYLKSISEPPLLIYNRTSSKSQQLANERKHVHVANTIEEIAKQADIIFSCLFNEESVKEIIGKQLIQSGHLKKNAILVDQTTISPEIATEVAKLTTNTSITYLVSMILGAPPRLKAKQAISLLSGPLSQRQQIIPYLQSSIGPCVVQVSEEQCASAKLKLCGNYMVFGLIEMVAQALTLGEASGIGQDVVKQMIDGIFAGTPFVDYSGRMVNETYNDQVLFSLEGALKDSKFILDLANKSNVDLPTTKAFQEKISTLQKKNPDLDVSGVVGLHREAAGLNFNLKENK